MVTRIRKTDGVSPYRAEIPHPCPPVLNYRKINLWVDEYGAALSGSVMWYQEGEAVEALVVAAGPFDTPEELLTRLLQELQLP